MNIKTFLLLLLVTSLALMAVVFYNGYPLTEGDSGAYIEQAIYPHFAPDRTPFYGLFVRVTSLWTSLWFTIFAQSLILAFLILKFIQHVFQIQSPNFKIQNHFNPNSHPDGYRDQIPNSIDAPNSIVLLTVISIISFTCVSWVTAYLMPDVFAGILLLAIILFISEQGNKKMLVLYAMFVFLAMLMHNSHFVITVLFSVALLMWSLAKKQKVLVNRCVALIAVCTLVWAIMCSMNAAKKHGFTFSRGKDVFMMAKLAETGILSAYLEDNCGKKNMKLCDYRSRIPFTLTEFLWSGESPLYKLGGWDSNTTEYRAIIHDVFTSPKYLTVFAQRSLVSTFKELVQVQAPEKITVQQGQNSEPWKKIRQYFADEWRENATSLQNNNVLNTNSWNFVYYLFLIFSSLWMLWCYPKVMNKELGFIYACMFVFFVLNAFVTSTFSTVIYRFQYRVSWVLPATNAIIMIKYYCSRLIVNQENEEVVTKTD